MDGNSVVIMGSGAPWPGWIDDRAGAISNVYVIVQHGDESVRELEGRTLGKLAEIADAGPLVAAVVSLGSLSSSEEQALAFGLLRELVRMRRRANRRARAAAGDLVLMIGDPRDSQRAEEVAALASFGTTAPVVVCRAGEPELVRRVA